MSQNETRNKVKGAGVDNEGFSPSKYNVEQQSDHQTVILHLPGKYGTDRVTWSSHGENTTKGPGDIIKEVTRPI